MSIQLRFYNGAGYHLKETPLSKDQTIKDLDGETIEVKATVRDNRRLHWWLLGFGGDVEVLAPKQLRTSVLESIEASRNRYQ